MRLGAKILRNVVDVNHWQHADQAHIAEGESNHIFIQLIDKDWSTKSSPEKTGAFTEYPIRYISDATTITVKAKFLSIDDDQAFEVTATQPYADDKSIFEFSLTSDQIPNAGNLVISVDEDGSEKTFVIKQAIEVDLINAGGC
jgi:hypothetical protein